MDNVHGDNGREDAQGMKRAGEVMMDQTLELSVWLGIAGVALVCARILLWRTRRILSRSRHEARVPEVRHAPASVTKLAS